MLSVSRLLQSDEVGLVGGISPHFCLYLMRACASSHFDPSDSVYIEQPSIINHHLKPKTMKPTKLLCMSYLMNMLPCSSRLLGKRISAKFLVPRRALSSRFKSTAEDTDFVVAILGPPNAGKEKNCKCDSCILFQLMQASKKI